MKNVEQTWEIQKTHIKLKNMVRQEVSLCLQSPYRSLERSTYKTQETKVLPLGVRDIRGHVVSWLRRLYCT